jgi:hypothetical protein
MGDESGWELALGFTSFVIAGAGMVGFTLGVMARYRCPRCQSPSMSLMAGGLLLSSRLPEHDWVS